MSTPQVHIIKHNCEHDRGYFVYDEATGVLMSDLSEKLALQIASRISPRIVLFDATPGTSAASA